VGGRKDWRKEGRKGKGKGGREEEEGEGGTCSKVLGGIDAPGPLQLLAVVAPMENS